MDFLGRVTRIGSLGDINTGGRLWYDANGLNMVEKRNWLRKEFKLYDTDKIASNFYPIQSALVIRDEMRKRQVTIMPDRAVAGAAGLRGSNIEMIQIRRLAHWDQYSFHEFYNMNNTDYYGIDKKATYYMQIFDYSKEVSKQREQQ